VLCQPKSQVHHLRNVTTHSRFRSFIAERNKARFEMKWSDALEQHEPFDDFSTASLARRGKAEIRQAGFRSVAPKDGAHRQGAALQKAFTAHLEEIA
jgi:hypothetical protein